MMRRLGIGILSATLLCAAAQDGAKAPASKPDRAPRAGSAPQTVDKLSRLSPEDRRKALASLPAQRRQNIAKRLDEIDKMPPAQQERVRARLEKLNALPPDQRARVRRSMQEFAALPQERKQVLNRGVKQLAALEPASRERYLAAAPFKDQYTESERRMMLDLAEVAPNTPAR